MAIDESTLDEIKARLKKALEPKTFRGKLFGGEDGDDGDEEDGEEIEAMFAVVTVEAEDDATVVFDVEVDVLQCSLDAQEEATMLIDEQWLPDVIAVLEKEIAADIRPIELQCRESECIWPDED
ncbi:MAG: hypothetical protein DRI90_02995 [Deltaproteobacteria bacterium]|nr:MAG: hypothetical protein DRI90_02995 [Deltaproteobacteria bacterium]